MRPAALAMGAILAATSIGLFGMSMRHGDDLADWGLPGLAALAAIAANVAFMIADRIRRERDASAR